MPFCLQFFSVFVLLDRFWAKNSENTYRVATDQVIILLILRDGTK
jgi:hypothetical protein